MMRRLADRIFAVGIVAALLLSSCASSNTEEPDLTVFGPWLGADAEAFRRVLDTYEEESGLTVRYTGSSSFITSIRERSEEGDLPDVAVFPQPGHLESLAEDGYVLPLRTDVRGTVVRNLLPALAHMADTERGVDAVPFRLSVKSLVWYRPDVFAEQGYAIPTTWDALIALTDEMRDDGFRPWCLGIAASDATGWPATDWVEDIVLRQSGTEVYDDWVQGTIPFTDDRIGEAMSTFREAVLANGYAGTRRSIINTSPRDAQTPMLNATPGCMLYRQASFQAGNLPKGTSIGPDGDVDVFVLPGQGPGGEPPLLVGGDVAGALTNRTETWDFLSWLATPEAGEPWAEALDFVSPYSGFDASAYTDAFDVRMAELVTGASVIRFDGSDRMYGPVGTGTFLEAMTLLVATNRVPLAQSVAQSGFDR